MAKRTDTEACSENKKAREETLAYRVDCVRKSVVAAADKIVHGYAEKDAELDKSVVIGLISAHFPARYGGF